MTGLMSAHETFQQAMDIEIREEVNRLLNLLLKPENWALTCLARIIEQFGNTVAQGYILS